MKINVVNHCNLRCYGCCVSAPVQPKYFINTKLLEEDLAAISGVLRVGEFRLEGGEPLLHPNIVEIADTARKSGISNKLTLTTNATLLRRMPNELWKLINQLNISVYPGVAPDMSFQEILNKAFQFGVHINRKKIPFTLRHLNNVNQNIQIISTVFNECFIPTWCSTFRDGVFYKCTAPFFLPARLQALGLEIPDFSYDGIPIHKENFKYRLKEYIMDKTPLRACKYCLGVSGKKINSKQMSKEDLEAWLLEDHSDPANLLKVQPKGVKNG